MGSVRNQIASEGSDLTFERRHFRKYGLSSKLNQINVSVLHRKVINIMKYYYPKFVTDLVTSVLANCITTMIGNTTSLIFTILTATVIAVHVRNVRTNRFRRKRSGFERRHFRKYGLSSKPNRFRRKRSGFRTSPL